VVNATLRQIYTQKRDPVPIVQAAGWALGPVWTVAKNLAYTNMGTVLNGFCIVSLPSIMEDDIL
jgi:hypothetical protein